MSTITESPSPNKPYPDWNNQVKIGRGRTPTCAFSRSIDIARTLFENGDWNGRGLLVVHNVYEAHHKMQFLREPLVLGVDYEFAADSVYSGAGPDEPAEVESFEREADDDETRLAGQNYGWVAENGEA